MSRFFFSKPNYKSYGLTDKGCVRDHNEDSFLNADDRNLWVVADGAGGHDSGEVASQLIIENLSKVKRSFLVDNFYTDLKHTLEQVNNELIALSGGESAPSLIASTVCLLTIEGSIAKYCWSGDSRLYVYRNKSLTQLTKDHNRVDEFVKAGFSLQEAERYPSALHLTSAVGVSSPLSLEDASCEVETGDIFLLCSDGLYNELSLDEIQSFMGLGGVETITHNLMNQALSRGARDNVTVVVVAIS